MASAFTDAKAVMVGVEVIPTAVPITAVGGAERVEAARLELERSLHGWISPLESSLKTNAPSVTGVVETPMKPATMNPPSDVY